MSYNKNQIMKLKEIFDEVDVNKSGSIDVKELLLALKNSDIDISEEDLKKTFKKADDDGSNSINFEEFINYLENN